MRAPIIATHYTTPGGPAPVPTPKQDEPGWAGPRSCRPARSPYTWTLQHEAVLGYGRLGRESVLHARIYTPELAADTAPTTATTGTLPGAEPVALLAQFGDHRGRSIAHSIAQAAATAQARFFPAGELMRVALLFPHPAPWPAEWSAAPMVIREVGFDTRLRRSRVWQWRQRRRARRARNQTPPTVTEVGPDGVTWYVLPGQHPTTNEWEFHRPRHHPDLALEIPIHEQDSVVGADPLAPEAFRWTRQSSVRVPALLGQTLVATWPEQGYTAEVVGGPQAAELAEARYAAVRDTIDAIGVLSDPNPDSYWELDR